MTSLPTGPHQHRQCKSASCRLGWNAIARFRCLKSQAVRGPIPGAAPSRSIEFTARKRRTSPMPAWLRSEDPDSVRAAGVAPGTRRP